MAKTKKIQPDRISEKECLELRLAHSDAARIEAQMTALQTQFQLLAPQLAPAKRKITELEAALKTTYYIGDKDTVDVTTGVITRGLASEPLEEPSNG